MSKIHDCKMPGLLDSIRRDALGKLVREAWVACKLEEQAAGMEVKPDHLLPWEQLPEREKETDRRIGEAVFRYAMTFLATWLVTEKEQP